MILRGVEESTVDFFAPLRFAREILRGTKAGLFPLAWAILGNWQSAGLSSKNGFGSI